MAKSKEERLREVHERALHQFDKIQSAARDERLQCLQDRRFYSIAGAQWEGPLGIQFENKPRYEVNKIHQAVMRAIGEYRNNKISAIFISKDGEDNSKLADTCASLYRAVEQDSMAEEAYNNAFEEAAGGGFGAWRLRCVYEDEEDDENESQKVIIEPITDADSTVFFDLDSKRQDKADAKHAYAITAYSHDGYKAEFGDDPVSWPKAIWQVMFDWLTPSVVYVAEYYEIEKVKEVIHVYRSLTGEEERYSDSDFDNDETLEDTLKATGWREVRQKKVNRKKCHKYIMNGNEILEDCGYIAGSCIPIVPVYGKRWFVDNVERCSGLVRIAKDAQRLKNMQLSKLAEYAAVSATNKPILFPEQIAGHQQMWAEDNEKNWPYLLLNQIQDANGNTVAAGPVAYSQAPDVPPAMAALMQIVEADMQDVLGNQQQADKVVSNISGDAVDMIQRSISMQTYILHSNMGRAIQRSAEIWLSMAKDVYVEEGRKLRSIGEDDKTSMIELMRPVQTENGIEKENDLSRAKFDVAVEVGPSSSSKRSAIVKEITGMIQAAAPVLATDQQTGQVLLMTAMMNMEGEGISETRDFFRKRLVMMGAVKPTPEEQMMMQQMQQQPQQPSAQDVYLMSAAQQAEADAAKSRADTLNKLSQARLNDAKTAETAASIDIEKGKHALEILNTVGERLMQPSTQPQPGQMPENK